MPTEINRKNVIPRAPAAIGILATVVWVFWFQKGELGYRMYGKSGVQYVAAGTTPIALLLSVFGIVLAFLLMRPEIQVRDCQISPLWRRYVAFLIDFWVCLFVFANVTTMLPLFLEAGRTGSFQWHFERDYSVPTDWVIVALVLLCMAAMVAYFVLPLANRRRTVGFWVLRIATVSAGGMVLTLPLSVALRHAYMEFTGLFSPSAVWKVVQGKETERQTAHDREAGLMVVRY